MKDVIRIILVFIPMFSVAFILRYFINRNRSKKQQTESDSFSQEGYILKMPNMYRVVSFLLIVFWLLVTIIILLTQLEDWPYIIAFGIFSGLPGIIMLICSSLWKVEVQKEKFIYRNFIGKTKVYQYMELKFQDDDKGIKWYFYKDGKKVFSMPYYIENGNKLERVYKKYQTKNRNKLNEEKKEEIIGSSKKL